MKDNISIVCFHGGTVWHCNVMMGYCFRIFGHGYGTVRHGVEMVS